MTSEPSIPASIGPYPIERELGRGGMGVVYLGRDPRLNRPVAIKVLPEEVARDPMRLSRFEREARTLASLNHKNVGLIYGLEQVGEQRLLVLEFVPGLTLTGRLTRGPMSLDEAFRVCVQVAEGLEAAHDRDVVHRDLKPDNLKITPDGTVKILDFGLATTRHGEGAMSEMATLAGGSSGPLTQQGMVMGTPGYMSPEQARGLPLDKRTDIWAFGCVLYECLAGTRAFNGLTASDMLVAVLEREPDFNVLPARTPARVRELLRKCLVKDARRRLRDIGDARNELEDVLSQPQSGWYRAAGTGAMSDRPRTVARLSMSIGEEGVANAARSSVAVSPDGQVVAYIAGRPPQTQLFVRRLENPEPLAIPGTAGAESPFFSPDGHRIAFFEGGKLKRVSLTGGAATVLAAAPRPQGGCWAEGDFIYFVPDWGKGLSRVPGNGGTVEEVARPDLASGEIALLSPEILPTGNAALVAVWTGAGFDAAMIVAIDLRSGQRRPLVQGGMNPRFVSSGHLVFTRIGGGSAGGSLLAVAFDPERLEVFGQPIAVEDRILGHSLGGSVHVDVGGEGTLVFAPGAVWEPRNALMAVERSAGAVVAAGESSPAVALVAEQRSFVAPAVSPDGTRLAVQVQGTSDHLFLYDLGRGGGAGPGAATRLTFHGDNGVPVWSPDGSSLVFRSNVSGQYELYAISADGAGSPRLVFSPAKLGGGSAGGSPSPCGFTRDGRHVLFTLTRPQGGVEIWMVDVADPASARPIVQTSRNAWSGSASPDGKFIAFACDETGREEVYIQPIPTAVSAGGGAAVAGRRQVTPEGGSGGTAPLWLPGAGGELAYRCGEQIVAVRVATEPSFMVGRTRVLAQGAFLPPTLLTRNFDAMPDAQRFVVARAEADQSRVTQLNVVLNWFDDLRRRVPVPLIAQPTMAGPSSRLGSGMIGASAMPATPAAPVPNTAFTEAATIMRPGKSGSMGG